jgi:sugar phosphate isomerase/epimerase
MEGSVERQLERIAEAGYTAYESPPPTGIAVEAFRDLLDGYGLMYIAQMHTDGSLEADGHAATFRERLLRTREWSPVLVNCHTGRDGMAWEEQQRLFADALEAEQDIGVRVAHETHRSRCAFTPWTTGRLLREFPALKLCADFSHWVCVTESFLERYAADVDLAIERSIHIHGRVGYFHGPQVTDPRAPESAGELAVHESWWRRIYERSLERGEPLFTFTPEFGPPGYMHVMPYTRQPLADLWEINDWMRGRSAEWMKGG